MKTIRLTQQHGHFLSRNEVQQGQQGPVKASVSGSIYYTAFEERSHSCQAVLLGQMGKDIRDAFLAGEETIVELALARHEGVFIRLKGVVSQIKDIAEFNGDWPGECLNRVYSRVTMLLSEAPERHT